MSRSTKRALVAALAIAALGTALQWQASSVAAEPAAVGETLRRAFEIAIGAGPGGGAGVAAGTKLGAADFTATLDGNAVNPTPEPPAPPAVPAGRGGQ